jgi:tetratricopeptide (TPR) repeat protein
VEDFLEAYGGRTRLAGVAAMAVVAALLAASAASGRQPAGSSRRASDLRRAGFELAYNLDHDEALAMFRRAVEADPGDPASYRAIAAITWLKVLFARGALTADEFLSSLPQSNATVKPPPADLAATFRTNIDKAIALAEAQVRSRPNDADANFNVGASRGLLAAYTVTVDGSLFGAVGLARGAFKSQERVIALDPSRKDAAFFTGSYRYAVANLASVTRWLAYLAGFSGGRERAIGMLEDSAKYPSDVQADAAILLVLVYNKEKRYDDALRLLDGLRRQFPRNRLLWLESGAAELRAGRPALAIGFLDTGIGMFERDPRLKVFGEAALWYAKRGTAHVALGDRALAEADLRKALAADGRDWVHGRCRLELGKLADLAGNRAAAVAEYQRAGSLCAGDRDPIGAQEAENLIARRYAGTNAAAARQ